MRSRMIDVILTNRMMRVILHVKGPREAPGVASGVSRWGGV